MRRLPALALLLASCVRHQPLVDGGVLGRVVIYRNGVAFYERKATVENGSVAVHVPRDRVDDFLKSLTVVDPVTRKPLSVTIPRKEADEGGYLTMTLETADARRSEVMLTYVTEAPAWKPSYRVVVGNEGKVMLEGWAIVDNVSGEDWKGVLVGVGASSALSFRYDLWSVRRIDRDLLQGEEKFAIAPPTGMSPYAEGAAAEELTSLDGDEVKGVGFEGDSNQENRYVVEGIDTTGLTFGDSSSTIAPSNGRVQGVVSDSKTGEKLAGVTVVATNKNQSQTAITNEQGAYTIDGVPPGKYDVTFYYAETTVERKDIKVTPDKTTPLYAKLDTAGSGGEVIRIESRAPTIDPTSTTQGMTITNDYTRNVPASRSFSGVLGSAPGVQADGGRTMPPPSPTKQGAEKVRGIVSKVLSTKKDVVIETHGTSLAEAKSKAEGVRNKLIDEGVPAAKIHVVPKIAANEYPHVRLLAVAPGQQPASTAPPAVKTQTSDTPVGESRFMADRPMTVRAGTSAMVAMVHGETTGGVVYLYDPISDRGDQRFAFKAVRLDNPTNDALEPGPVTVYGDGRFIGEGITEPVPARASVVVPFALDKQIVIEKNDNETDHIAKLITAQRGVVTAEVQHRRHTKLTVTSRLGEPAKVYIRHRLEPGWELISAPEHVMKVGDSQLFEVEVGAHETKYVTIAEATPVQKTFELASDAALDMMKVYIDEPEASPELRAQIEALLATNRAAADITDRIATLRDQLAEYRSRAGELHAQVVTLKMVKSGGELMSQLRAKFAETSDRIQKTTITLVDAQEQLMLTRVKFQNQLADLKLTDATRSLSSR